MICDLRAVANRLTIDGEMQDTHKCKERAKMAANIIAEKYGWTKAEERDNKRMERIHSAAMSVAYQGTKDVQVLVLPKEASVGRTLTAQSSSPMIASLSQEQVVIDENGLATLTLNGELPGGVVLTLSVDGTDVEKTVKVSVVIGRELVSTPVASIRNGDRVELGTKLALTCDTEGATIYYTLDGSCPCNTATRQKYTEPFTLPNGVVTVKAMAETEDGEKSDVVTAGRQGHTEGAAGRELHCERDQ